MQKEKQLRSYYKNNLSSPNTHHSSFRSVSMRDIVAGVPNASLYPGLQISGMTSEASVGFTLIELLVVVLIIGILAAVALPQYQKAVEKSRATQALTILKSLVQAQDAYKMANGSYAKSFDELPVEMSWTRTETWGNASIMDDTRSNGEWSLQLWFGGSDAVEGNSAIYLGRLKGKYQGAGFVYFFQNGYSFPNQQILCAERRGNGLTFGQVQGSYCSQIWKGELVAQDSGLRMYKMP